MRLRAAVGIVVVGCLVWPGAAAHGREVEGTVELTSYVDYECRPCRIVPPEVWVQIRGLQYEVIEDVRGGDAFALESKEPQQLMMVGTDDECPEGNNDGDPWDPNARPTDADWWANDFNLMCNHVPDFDIKFTGGDYENGPGNEAGNVPGDGVAVVVLYIGSPDTPAGPENFVYHDGF